MSESANPPDWCNDPWVDKIENGRLYGRGAADIKGSLAAMIHAAASIERNQLAGRVFVSATVAEETVEGGTFKQVVDETAPDYVVIGEATELESGWTRSGGDQGQYF
ncbi:MAG: M20/M25/M40 family metallo-hydrolase [Chloroflexi bacterium]|nr:M20/M25/M40 family metallo-hydrolase [Chloroflexota bacterium]